MSQGLPGSTEPALLALLALQAAEHLPLPALLDPLDPHRRNVDRYSGLEARAEESMHVGMRQAILAAVLMDREDALSTSSGPAESLLDSVAQDALRKVPVEAPKRSAVGLSTVRMKRK
jgi:hypothetical protein